MRLLPLAGSLTRCLRGRSIPSCEYEACLLFKAVVCFSLLPLSKDLAVFCFLISILSSFSSSRSKKKSASKLRGQSANRLEALLCKNAQSVSAGANAPSKYLN